MLGGRGEGRPKAPGKETVETALESAATARPRPTVRPRCFAEFWLSTSNRCISIGKVAAPMFLVVSARLPRFACDEITLVWRTVGALRVGR